MKDTFAKCRHCIVQQQRAFLSMGRNDETMVLNTFAEMVDMHESTISRVTTQNTCILLAVFLSKILFSKPWFSTFLEKILLGWWVVLYGNEKHCIKKAVAAEIVSQPLSDSEDVCMSVIVSVEALSCRRTIANTRVSLDSPVEPRKSLL